MHVFGLVTATFFVFLLYEREGEPEGKEEGGHSVEDVLV